VFQTATAKAGASGKPTKLIKPFPFVTFVVPKFPSSLASLGLGVSLFLSFFHAPRVQGFQGLKASGSLRTQPQVTP
jgi:predicted benzoate:H+ symporter BenE